MSRRARALLFLVAALACAALAATIAGGYGSSVSNQLGELRPVLVASSDLPAREPISPREARRSLEVRRVPERFAPASALTSPTEVVGRELAVPISAGAYITSDQLRVPKPSGGTRERLPADLSPVEIQVSGAGSLAAGGSVGEQEVDVVVTTEPGPGGSGRTYVAASAVPLLALVDSTEGTGAVEAPGLSVHTATLALTRSQSLRLIDAESFARQVRLIPR